MELMQFQLCLWLVGMFQHHKICVLHMHSEKVNAKLELQILIFKVLKYGSESSLIDLNLLIDEREVPIFDNWGHYRFFKLSCPQQVFDQFAFARIHLSILASQRYCCLQDSETQFKQYKTLVKTLKNFNLKGYMIQCVDNLHFWY